MAHRLNRNLESPKEADRRVGSYTLPYFQVIRAEMILLATQGLGNHAIASRLDTRREVVSLWRKRFFAHRLAGLEELPRSGRPRAFPPEPLVYGRTLACEPPTARHQILSRWSIRALGRETRSASSIAAAVSDITSTTALPSHGSATAGSSPANRTSPTRRTGSWTSITALGRAALW